jgi:hypothetical protein
VINENPGQVKQPGEPGNHENNMKGFQPKHVDNSMIHVKNSLLLLDAVWCNPV